MIASAITPAGLSAAPRSIRALAAAIFLGCLTLTALGVLQVRESGRSEARFRFERLAERLRDDVRRRMNQSVYGLKGARGVFAASKSVERLEFRAYVESRNLAVEFPGVLGFGYIQRVARPDLDRFITAERADAAPDFSVRTSGAEPVLYPIKFLEPLSGNREAVGFDIGSEAVRREAIGRAIRTGEPTLTGHITLAQDARQRPGFLYLVPVFRNGSHPTTPAERDAALVGLVFAPLVIDDVLANVMAGVDRLLDVEIFEGTERTSKTVLFDADRQLVAVADRTGAQTFGGRLFSRTFPIEIGGRKWTFAMSTTKEFEAGIEKRPPIRVAIAGLLVSGLLSGIVLALGSSRSRAQALARQITASLRTSEAEARRLAMVASRTSNAVVITDTLGRIEWVNDGFTRITGYTLAEVQGRTPGSFLQGALTDPLTVSAMRAAVRVQQEFRVEIVNYSKSGRPYWLDVEVQPLRDPAGALTGFMAIESDITARKTADLKLLASEQRLTALTAQAPGVIFQFEVSPTGRRAYAFLSGGYRALFGRDPAEALRRPIVLFESVHKDDKRAVWTGLEEAIARGAPWIETCRIVTPDGTIRWINARSSASQQPDGTKVWFGILVDITEQQQARFMAETLNTKLAEANRSAQQAVARAEQANAAKNRVLGMAAHDLRNPLASIRGLAEFLREGAAGALAAEQLVLIETIHGASESMLDLVSELLDVATIEAGELKLNLKPHNLAALLGRSVAQTNLDAAKKATRIHFAPHRTVPALMIDAAKMRQVIDNLLSNAVKYSPPGSTITVTLTADRQLGTCTFAVQDQGPGIPENERDLLFKDFSRLSAEPTGGEKSTGLGLAICQKIAEAHRGAVAAVNLPAGGCEFRVTLTLLP